MKKLDDANLDEVFPKHEEEEDSVSDDVLSDEEDEDDKKLFGGLSNYQPH